MNKIYEISPNFRILEISFHPRSSKFAGLVCGVLQISEFVIHRRDWICIRGERWDYVEASKYWRVVMVYASLPKPYSALGSHMSVFNHNKSFAP